MGSEYDKGFNAGRYSGYSSVWDSSEKSRGYEAGKREAQAADARQKSRDQSISPSRPASSPDWPVQESSGYINYGNAEQVNNYNDGSSIANFNDPGYTTKVNYQDRLNKSNALYRKQIIAVILIILSILLAAYYLLL